MEKISNNEQILDKVLDKKMADLREFCQNNGIDFKGSIFHDEQRMAINAEGKIYVSPIDQFHHTAMVIIDAKMENGKNILTVANCSDLVYCRFGNYRDKQSGILDGISVVNSEKILYLDRIVFRFNQDKTEIEMNKEGACSVKSVDYEYYLNNYHLKERTEKYISDIQEKIKQEVR